MASTCITLLFLSCWTASENLRCLPAVAGDHPPARQVSVDLHQQIDAALEHRRDVYEQLKTPAQIAAYQQRLRQLLERQLGGFPARTPLNAQVVGTLDGEGYRVEKVLFESQPGHHVTAALFLPLAEPPFPGVVVASGHSRTAKAADYNQRFGIALARHGMAAICYDPIGQGERSQILTAEGRPQMNSTTREHFLIGVGSILVGTNTARYRIWDGIRTIDYLSSRKDIDADRIGFTGCSGGGTLTSYVMALDERVACAAPSCYLTTFGRLMETIGPQDAEQNIFGQIALGLDQPDYVLMRAPQPTLISATTDDFFDIRGTWDTFRQAKRLYARLGRSERVDLVEAPGGHGVQPENLVGIVRWMRRWLVGMDDAAEIASSYSLHSEAELRCTETGQALAMAKERSVFDLNVEREQRLAAQRRAFWEKSSAEESIRRVRQRAGIRPLAEIAELKMEKAGKVQREEYHIDKLVLRTSGGVPLPALTFHPPDPREDAYLYLHGKGKEADGAAGGPIDELVAQGYVVVAVDLRGLGETGPDEPDELLGNWKLFYEAYLLGESLVGLRTEEALACGRWIAHYETDDRRRVHLVGVGSAGVVALHAAALEPELFASLTLRDTLDSWAHIVGEPMPRGVLTSAVHDALSLYDLPDLRRLVGPRLKQ